ncbi:pilus assembly protein TadG-related protein [Sphingomonas sp.]|uniref:pilus assembly protein TadG-related protein n=1 Tax=Sphingomonas sp. TaxID=28214 RepID=UPI00286C433C|nr:pilus assembly protein TadG-related protein [Sphingomonas sp.]
MRKVWARLKRNNRGAVAPTVALSLVALIATGGIAFDYAHTAALDTELQDAADQSALAAASQLDGQANAQARATAAAQSLVRNLSLFASDNASAVGDPRKVEVATLTFYQSYDRVNDTYGTLATGDTDSKVVRVTITPRLANFALTPIVGAFSSGPLPAEAVASLGTAICKTPPVMICNPAETATNKTFDANSLKGRGLKLVSVGAGNGSWAPGNFGYLNNNGGSNGVPGLQEGLGWSSPPGDCTPSGTVNTKPGGNVPATDALNTRFDIYDSNSSCQNGGVCPSSIDSVKDLVRPANASGNNACALQNAGWQLSSNYYGKSGMLTSVTPLATTVTPTSMGHPRDICHTVAGSVTGNCSANPIGDGAWDRDAYFRTNYLRGNGTRWSSANWQANTGLSPSVAPSAANFASRYNVYLWEIANRGTSIDGVTVLGPNPSGATGTTLVSHGIPVCSQAQTPSYGTGTVPNLNTPDRRSTAMAVVNCQQYSVNGSSTNVPVLKFVDLFLVEPSVQRDYSGQGDVYVEIIRETPAGGAQTAGQVVRRDKPFLIR